jgi:archaetidylinositol phosphate synthase
LNRDKFYKEVRNSALLEFASKKAKHFNPNTITLVGLVFAMLAGLLFAYGIIFCAIVFVTISGFLDLLDGAVAEMNDKKTEFGEVLDSVSDRYADTAIMAGIVLGYSLNIDIVGFSIPGLLIGIVAIVGSIMVSYVRAKGESVMSEKITTGITDRPTRIGLVVLGVIFGCMNYAILVIAVLTHFTVLQRMQLIKKKLEEE